MSICIIELNDIAVTARSEELESVGSPGYALIQGDELLIGEAARVKARLHPLQLNNRFWQRLSMDPLRHAGGNVRHHADLAYAHLLQLHELAGKPEEVIFTVPGHYSVDKLSVLLGIAKHCPFKSVGLVDSAVAATAGEGLDGDAIYIELQLHQAVLTRLSATNEVVREAVQTVEGVGLLTLYDRWASIVAEAFIEQCRFDPLHSASSEQFVYDLMPQFLDESDALIEVEVPQGTTIHHARIARKSILQAATDIWQQVSAQAAGMGGSCDRYLLSHQWSRVPGILSFSPNSVLLQATPAVRACLENIDLVRSESESVSFVTRLPGLKLPSAKIRQIKEEVVPVPAVEPPTHVLVGSTAYSLASPCYLQDSSDGISCGRQAEADSHCSLSLQDGKVSLKLLGERQVWLKDRAIGAGDLLPGLVNGDVLYLSRSGQPIHLIHVQASLQYGQGNCVEA